MGRDKGWHSLGGSMRLLNLLSMLPPGKCPCRQDALTAQVAGDMAAAGGAAGANAAFDANLDRVVSALSMPFRAARSACPASCSPLCWLLHQCRALLFCEAWPG